MRLTLSPHVGTLGRGRRKSKNVQEGRVNAKFWILEALFVAKAKQGRRELKNNKFRA